ncbi:MAG: 2-dehydropantoate 2-reductase [Planctomycetota bacterium]
MLDNKGEILEYIAPDGTALKYRFFGDDSASDAVVYVNGLESHGEWFCDAADYLAKNGYAVCLWDRRGSGLNETEQGDCKSYQQFVDDLAHFIEERRKRHRHIHLIGHSWGGKFAAYFTVRRQFLVDSLALISPGLAPKVGYSLFRKIGVALALLKNKTKLCPTPIKTEMFTSNREALEYIENDPLRLKEVTARFLVENLKMDLFLKQNADGVRVPVALFLAGKDEVIDNGNVRAMFARFHPHIRRTREWNDAKHCLLFEKPDGINEELLSWLRDCLSHQVSPRKILIAGAGGVGCVVGGMLAMGGHDVTLLARKRHTEAIKANGLKMTLFGFERKIENITAVTDAGSAEQPDIIIVCVKSFDTKAVIEQIKSLIRPGTILLSLQNGVGNEEALARAFPDNPVAGGVILGYFSMTGDGRCETRSDRGGILLGAHANMNGAALGELAGVLRDSQMIVRAAEDCRGVKWSKLLLNAAFNALSAVTDLPAEELLADKKLFALNRRLFRECLAVMQKQGIPVYDLPGYMVKKLAMASGVPNFIASRLRKLGRSEQGGRSSMWYDVTSGRGRTEVDFLNAVIVAEGEKCGVSTPANAHVTKIVKEIISNKDAREKYARDLSLVYNVPKRK